MRSFAYLPALFAVAFAGMAAGSALAADDWKAKWDATVAAANKEGALVVSGPSGRVWTEELQKFSKDFPKIRIKVTPFASRDFWPRLTKEREVGQHLWDLRVGGADTGAYRLLNEGGLAAAKDMFILPEVVDESNWITGKTEGMYLDNAQKYMPTFCIYKSQIALINNAFIKDGEIKDFKELTDPKWKGKMAMADPRGGSTATTMAVIYKKFGADFVKDLLVTQEPVIVSNLRQLMDWFVSGKYPIAMGMPTSVLVEYKDRGIKVDMGEVPGLSMYSTGVCGLEVIEPRPHPNATTVFVNWILTRKVQEPLMQAIELNSRMKGVPPGNPETVVPADQIDNYVSGQTEEYYAKAAGEARTLVRSLVK
jgi:iron(III) transport system substrate-binding protein